MSNSAMDQIFLSYAHDDDETPTREQEGWVSFFDRTLDIELRQQGYRDRLAVFRDKRDLRPDTLDRQIIGNIQQSKALLSVVSPAYLQRPYCQLELTEFLNCRNQHGVILIAKRPFDKNRLPDDLHNQLYIAFFEEDREKGRLRLYFDGFGAEISPEYWYSIRAVADAIIDKIKGQHGTKPEEFNGHTVFLAETNSKLKGQRARLAQELKNRGHRVVPQGNFPTDAEQVTRLITKALSEADYAIHLIGSSGGFVPENTNAPITELQLELSAEHANAHPAFKRLIWLSDKPYTQPPVLAHDELIQRPVEVFINTVLSTLEQVPESAAEAVASLYLLYHPDDDLDHIAAFSDEAVNAGFAIEPVELSNDQMLDQLAAEDAMLICWQQASAQQIKDAIDCALDAGVNKIGLLRLQAQQAAQKLFRHPRLTFNLTLDEAQGDTLTQALEQLKPGAV